MSALKLHNAMWPGLVGKGDDEGQEPPISLERMLDLTAAAEVDGQKYDGIDYFLFLPHTNPEASDDELKGIADLIQGKGFDIGSLVAPVWPGTVGDSAMGTEEQRGKFLDAVRMACRIAKIFNEHGARKRGVIRIDSAEFGVEKWREDAAANTATIVSTFKEAAKIAADHGERGRDRNGHIGADIGVDHPLVERVDILAVISRAHAHSDGEIGAGREPRAGLRLLGHAFIEHIDRIAIRRDDIRRFHFRVPDQILSGDFDIVHAGLDARPGIDRIGLRREIGIVLAGEDVGSAAVDRRPRGERSGLQRYRARHHL